MTALPWEQLAEVASDPDRFLEESTPRVRAWERERDDVALEALRGDPAFRRVAERVAQERQWNAIDPPRLHGDQWFRLAGSDSGWELLSADTLGGAETSRLTAAELPPDAALDWLVVSPDGRRVALGLSPHGSEETVLHVFDLDERRLLDERIPNVFFSHVAWLPDGSGFFFSRGRARDFFDTRQAIFFHRVGESPSEQPEPLELEDPYVFAEVAADGTLVAAFEGEDRRLRYLRDLGPAGEWRCVPGDTGPLRQGFLVGDAYIAISTAAAPSGRVVRIPLSSAGDPSTWTELVPESRLVLRSIVRAGRFIVLVGLEDGFSRVQILTLTGDHVADVALPDEGTVSTITTLLQAPLLPLVASAGEAFTFVFSTYNCAPAAYHYDIADGRLTTLIPSRRPEGPKVVARRTAAVARDGTAIPMTIVHRADLDDAGSQPTLIHAYGGWNVALVPAYLADLNILVEAGAVLVLPNLRGGGELGDDWWNASRRRTYAVRHADLYAVAEFLIGEGIAHPDALAFAGASHGGLLACAALAERPDLFGAVVALVPVTDLLRFTRDPCTWTFVSEYGDPLDPDDAQALSANSPYHNLDTERSYPPTLIVGAELDIRCPSWHARKFAARLMRANTGSNPVLLRVWPKSGHLEFERGNPEHAAEWITFALRELGLEAAPERQDAR
jgi:prolyl oligopeptidase